MTDNVLNKTAAPKNGWGCDYCEEGSPCPAHDVCMSPGRFASLVKLIATHDRSRLHAAVGAQIVAAQSRFGDEEDISLRIFPTWW